MTVSLCQQQGHDYGNGPGELTRLGDGEEQTCPHCGLSRRIVNGTLKYSRKPIATRVRR